MDDKEYEAYVENMRVQVRGAVQRGENVVVDFTPHLEVILHELINKINVGTAKLISSTMKLDQDQDYIEYTIRVIES